MSTFGNLRDTEREHSTTHGLPILIFVQLPIKVQLEVDQFSRTQSHHDLPLVRRCTNDGLARRHPPFVNTMVNEDVSDTVWVNLEQGVSADLLHRKSRCGRKEARVLNFLDRLADAEHQCSVDERQDDVGVIGV